MYLNKHDIITNEHTKTKKNGTFIYTSKKHLHYFKCDECGKDFTRFVSKNDTSGILQKPEHYCDTKCGRLASARNSHNTQKKNKENLIGTIREGKDAYPEIYTGYGTTGNNNHGRGGWVRLHRYVMENHIGRGLTKNEVVHHIDGDKTNNSIENLHLMTISEHNQCHAESEQIVFELVKQGKVLFNKTTQRYELL